MIYIEGPQTADDDLPMVLWDNKLTGGAITASSTFAGTLASNTLTETTYDFWKSNVSGSGYLTVDMATPTKLDSVSVVAHNLGSIGATVKVQYSSDGVTFTDVASVDPTDDSTILIIIPAETYQYWRLDISGGSDYPIVGVFIGGERFVFPGGVKAPYTPIWQSQSVELLQSMSLNGQFLGNRVIRKGAMTQINLTAVERTFAEGDLQPFRKHYNDGQAFVWAAGPLIFPNDVAYCWRRPGAEMKPTFDQDGVWMAVGMEIEAYVE